MSKRVLIVDDSLTVRMDLTDAFESAGFETIGCATAAQARQALAGDAIDIVILDVQLPDGNGIDLLEEARLSPATAGAMVIMLSSEAEVKDRIKGMRRGADDYIGKPYDAVQIVARARNFLRTRSRDEPRDSEPVTILIVDDSATFRHELGDICVANGYRTLLAETGEEGLQLAAYHRPDAMIVDRMLPGIDGITVIRRLRGDIALRDIPCLLLTASEETAEELRALEAGANAFVRKSDALDVILARLRAILRQAHPRTHQREIPSLLASRKLLVVDESDAFGRMLSDRLRDDAHELVRARDGEEALALLDVQPVDCILLNLVLPDMGGLALCRQIKDNPKTRDIPLLVMTEREDPDTIVEGLGAGADDYVSKAGDPHFIRARILAQLRRKQAGDEQRRIREQMLLHELETAEARAIRDVAQVRAALADELAERNAELAVAKAELQDYARTLEDRVRERSRQLGEMEQQLRHAQKMEAIGQLTGGIAHDFNNLLGIVTGNLDLLIEHLEGDAEGLELADEALQGALRGATLTQRMLAFARKQPLQPAVTDLNEALTAMEGLLRRTLSENINIRFAPAADLRPGYCDKHQVEDAILNFAINARDAMVNGGELVIETANAVLDEEYADANIGVTPGDYVMLAVSDSGSGMPPEVIERAFDPFFTTKATGKGTGLGLSMAYGFAKQSGGHIKIYSEVGFGTTIKLYLPRAQEESDGRPMHATTRAARRSNGDETVLIVEDDPGLRQVAIRMIADLGYATHSAQNPREALAMLAAHPAIDLVFSDIVMPGGMTGIQLAKEIASLRPDVKVLLTTGYSETFVQHENGDLAGAGFLPKPYRKQDLAEKLREMLDEKRDL
jgi:two-component system NtrC family sensor kinase